MLYPVENEIRQVKSLDGIWRFKKEEFLGQGVEEKWYIEPLAGCIEMPVPASYNDITTDRSLRDHVGWVWYEKDFYIPSDWTNKRLVLRFGSVTHHATVYVNGEKLTEHKGGFLPFEAVLNGSVTAGKNRVTVAVSNMLDHACLPFGLLRDADPAYYPEGTKLQDIHFDFFNYAGIHRPVKIYTTPLAYVKDVTVVTDIAGNDGIIDYSVIAEGDAGKIEVSLLDEDGVAVAQCHSATGRIVVANAHFWEVRAAYLYQLDVRSGEDHYTLPVGIRTVTVTGKQILLNGKPVYLKGFGKHEDSDIKGKGLDDALNVRDFELLKWIGANSFRTSHYPYSEEIMQMADRQGFLVIDEAPAVGMNYFDGTTLFLPGLADTETLEHHKAVLTELYARDKNHPCVIMWSVTNEPCTNNDNSLEYFSAVTAHMRALDPVRPVVGVINQDFETEHVAQLFDVICLNRYYSWYTGNPGATEVIYPMLIKEFNKWHEQYGKPVMMTEYGADTIPGLHKLPEVIFSEEYQIEYYKENNRAIDACDFVVGEHLWAFSDFMTGYGLRRFDGNKKGIFTRQRQPKSVAFHIKERWAKKN